MREQEDFIKFLELVRSHVYSEPDTQLHMSTIDSMATKIMAEHPPTGEFADIGCGSGYAMEKLKSLGCTANMVGVTLSPDDAETAEKRGFKVFKEDMSFLSFDDNSKDYLWVRHALEHSPFPLMTLIEFYRVMAPGAKAYIEMPSPKCARLLEAYDNHYSIMGMRQWACLMERAGFTILDKGEIKFTISAPAADGTTWSGDEVYEFYVLQK